MAQNFTLDSSDYWALFAAAALQSPGLKPTFSAATRAKDVAELADAMHEEFRKRWEWYSGGYGSYWKRRPEKKET